MDDQRLSQLYRQYGGVIYARCRWLLGDDAAAEDATQETFLRVLRHLDRAPDANEAIAWIYRIATNYCLNELRDRRRRPEPREALPDPVGGAVEQLLADRDLAARLVERAPEKLRAVAFLHHVDGLDQGEVARVLGISRRTVVARLQTFAANAHKFVRRIAS
ncbi:MAG TPA: sigma-70 family RNA polymerase sigma factor [Polyangia bacterium]|nr:sigma-70 family RNA polymerase sigma factor [Polyangia bacterium]